MNAALQAQQRALQQAICQGSVPALPQLLQQGGANGLAVYQQAYPARLLAALRDNFSVLQRALGDADFEALGLAYIQARPSRRPSIRWFGDGLADFMAGDGGAALGHPCMRDFARMDWALRAAFDSADAPCLRAEQLAAIAPADWPGLVFKLQASVQILALNWAIEPAWAALRAQDEAAAEPEAALSEPAALDHHLLVWREGLDTRWRSLAPLEARLLLAVAEAQDFTAICQLAAQSTGPELAAGTVVQALHTWLASGLLTAWPIAEDF